MVEDIKITYQIKKFPHEYGGQKTTTYDSGKEHIIQHIQKSYEQGFEVDNTFSKLQKTDFNENFLRPSRLVNNETYEVSRKA